MFKLKIDPNQIKEYLKTCGPNTKAYFGCDSERFRLNNEWYVDYSLCIAIHQGHGAKLFGEVVRERVWDNAPMKPSMRLMTEVQKVSELYLSLEDLFKGIDCEIHLDLNANKKHKSSDIVQAAIGYIKGTCMLDPKIKPEAWAASCVADRFKELASQAA